MEGESPKGKERGWMGMGKGVKLDSLLYLIIFYCGF